MTGSSGSAESSAPVLLGDILQRLQLVDEDQVKEALEFQKKSGKLFGESLLELGFIGEDDLSWALSSQLNLPFVAISPDMVDRELVDRYPRDFLRKHLVLPLVASETTLSVVLADPTDEPTMHRLERISGLEISVAVGTPSAIRETLATVVGDPEEEASPLHHRSASLNSPALAQLLDRALSRGAVYVHLDHEPGGVRLRYRTAGGELIDEDDFDAPSFKEIVRGLTNCMGEGEEPAPGIHTWNNRNVSLELPFRAEAVTGAFGMCLTLALDHSAYQLSSNRPHDDTDWSRFDEIVKSSRGLVLGTSPEAGGRNRFLSRALRDIDGTTRRCCAMVSDNVDLPEGVIRFGEAATASAMITLSDMHGFDTVAASLSGLASLPAMVEAASRDRLVVSAFPGQSALGLLIRMLEEGVSATQLSEALLVIVALREIRSADENSSLILTETLYVDTPLREALQNGGAIEDLRVAARKQKFEEMAMRAKNLDAVSEDVREDLERHRYLKEAA